MATGYQVLELNDDDFNLTFDWGECETRQIVKAFPISDYGTEYQLNQPSIEYPLVSEPPTLSGIIDSTIKNPQPRTLSDIEEKYIEDDMSSLSQISDIEVSEAQQKHEYAKERMERKGNIYDMLYNTALKGELGIVKNILENLNTMLVPDENGQTALYAACIGNHLEIINVLIDSGYDVNHQDNEGKTVLHIAFENHIPDLAKTLIARFSANTDIRDIQNWTPLHTAIDRGYFSYSKKLSEKFLHKDICTEVSWIQLQAACIQENTQYVLCLLDANTDVNHASSAGYTSLHIAVSKSNIDLVTLLLDHDVNVNSVTIDGRTPLHIAAEKGDEIIIQKLLTHGADPSLKDSPGNTSLHVAVRVKGEAKPIIWKIGASKIRHFPASYHICSTQTVQAIIDHGADVNAVNNRGQTALWFACIDGQNSIVKFLLDAGADPTIADRYEDTCLHAAIHGNCSTETIQKILDHGAPVNAVNKDVATPLLLACSTAQAETVKILLVAKADPNSANADGDACLHVAMAADCNKETILEIISYGADVNAVNKRGRTALLLGCFYRQMDAVKILLEAQADPAIADEEGFSCLHAAIDGYCSKDTLQALIDHGAHIAAIRKDGTNALLRACTTGQSESVSFLVEAGACVNITNSDGNTCLHLAVKGECNKDAVQEIIEHGMININAVNKHCETALLLACESAQAKTVNLLLQKLADPNISDGRGFTSLHAAVHGCCANETLQEIINHKAQLYCQDNHGETALFNACSYRQQESVKILLKAESNPNIADNNDDTSLHAAVRGGCSKTIIHMIIDQGVEVNATNKQNETALLVACVNKHVGAINVLLNGSADPNITEDTYGYACLHIAVRQGCSTEVVQAIIDHGADVNATNNENQTALQMACIYKHEGAINVLLNTNADLNITDTYGETCLHTAVRQGCSIEVVQAIIDHGADVNATNKNNKTALMKGCYNKHEGAINVLLNASADLNITDGTYGDTCLHKAVRQGCSTEVVQAIIDHGADVNATNKNNKTALMKACYNKHEGAINVLLNASADLNIADMYGETCLHKAVRQGCSTEVVQAIIDHGADVNATNKENETPLTMACIGKHEGATNVLLNASADPNITDTYGDTCLQEAVRHRCNTEVVQAIIDHGADVNTTNKKNTTALMIACSNSHEDAVHVLLNATADPNITEGYYGDTCLHIAVRQEFSTEVLQIIIDHGVDVKATNKKNQTALTIACINKDAGAINVLLNAGADPNITDDTYGCTCLHIAVDQECSIDVVQAIIDHGADVNATNKKNETALTRGCINKHEGAIHVLLNASANPNISDDTFGHTCLHMAVRQKCSTEVVQAIIDHGADVNATNKKNRTALNIACINKHEGAINVLLNTNSDLNITDTYGETCLHTAVRQECSTEVVQAIIDHGADVNATNKNNKTALMKGCYNKHEGAINVLLNASADLNITDGTYGDTCLHKAVRQGCSTEVVQAIIDHGADVNATNKKNETALTRGCINKHEGAIHVLLNASANPNISDDTFGHTCLHMAVRQKCSTEVVQAIIDHGADVNATNKKNRTALNIACINKHEGAINVLLNTNSDLNITDSYGETCLHTAVRQGCNTEVVQAIIDHGADVNATNKNNETALMKGCYNKHEGAIHVLLNASANPNISDDTFGHTCLHMAVRQKCSTEVVQAIIDHGADVNATNKKNRTALNIACINKHEGAINVLLNTNADPNITDDTHGDTCLHMALRQGCSTEVVQAIIDHGADVNATNKENETSLAIACIKKNKCAINVLLNTNADPNIADDTYGCTCLHISVIQGCTTEVVQAIIDHGADVNATNKKNQTALTVACINKHEGAINVLLNTSAGPNITDGIYGDTCLHKAVRQECGREVLQAIIDHGADVNATNKKNQTALTIACIKKDEGAINVLLNANADPNITDDTYGCTCLHIAVNQECSIEVVQAIIDHGADVNATNKENETALTVACINKHEGAINVLLNTSADPNITDGTYGDTCLHKAVRQECGREVLQAIIDHGADVNETNKKNQTALTIACIKKDEGAINVLLNANADPNITDDTYGCTCLHIAVDQECSIEVVQAIIDHGADVNATNKENVTAFVIASNFGYTDAINVLLNASADPNMTDDTYGDTCLHKAVRQGCSSDVLQAIIDHGVDVNATNKYNVTAFMIASHKGNTDAINVLLNAGADPDIGDVNSNTCSSLCCLWKW